MLVGRFHTPLAVIAVHVCAPILNLNLSGFEDGFGNGDAYLASTSLALLTMGI